MSTRRTATRPFVALRRLVSARASWLVCVAVGVIAVGSAHVPAAESRTIAAPTAANDSYTTPFNTTLSVDAPGVLSNDTSDDGSALEVASVVVPTFGTLTIDGNGSFTFTPPTDFIGTVTFEYTAGNASGVSATATVTITVTESVAPPTNLTATSIVGNTVTITWTAAAGATPTGYVLEGGISPGQVLASVPTGSTATTLTFTAPTGAFYIRVHALTGSLKSAASNEIRIFVNLPAAPSAPANLLGLVNGSSLALAWANTAAGGTPTGLTLDVTGALALSVNLPLSETFSFAGVPAGTYTFAVRAANSSGVSGPSNSVTLTFPGPCSGVPGTPMNFLATKSGNVISLSWALPASGPAPIGYTLSVTGAFVANIPLNGRSISGGVGPGSYTLSVIATNACGSSPATTPQTVVIP
jgi:large repetitive protein